MPPPVRRPAGNRVAQVTYGIGAMIQVEQGALGALEEHVLAARQGVLHERASCR